MAAAFVGAPLLSAFLQVLLDRMTRPEFLNMFRNREVDDDLLKKLKADLLTVGAVLDDAENKEILNQSVKIWLEDLHDTFYQAEDLLDRINTEALRIKVEAEYQSSTGTRISALRRFCSERILPCASSGNKLARSIIPELKTTVSSLDVCIQQISHLGLQVVQSRVQPRQQFEIPLVDQNAIFGRDADKEKLIQELQRENANGDNISVIPIVGLGGLGKTTLARMVYEDMRVGVDFSIRAWVCVSEEYDATRITKGILRELNMPFVDDDTFITLQGKLQIGLNGKKFLIVLDDVWNSNYNDWDNLRIPFKGGLLGSKIIVTTRNLDVARMIGKEESIHHLDVISENDCWFLFEKHTFENRKDSQNPKLQEIGKKIVNKCGGMPLAVKTVAGILRSRTTPEEWEEIFLSEEWTRLDNQNGPIPALRLSYIYLPSYLKRCFAYCAVFHKNYQFKKEEVIQLWKANDLLEYPGENQRTQNKGEKCFYELKMRSLFQQSTNNSFSMHDLVNDLARLIFGKYCLRLEDLQERDAAISGVRHFSYHREDFDTFHKFPLLKDTKNLRTFLPLSMVQFSDCIVSNKFLEDTLPQFMSLRVLSLSHYWNIVKLPDSYSGLKQLRMLNLSSTSIKVLPEWICSFCNLQTLLLSKCSKLTKLPVNLGKLINLCCLDISETPLKKMPPQMGKLINLQVLTSFVIGNKNCSTVNELGKLPMLRGKLFLSGLENVSDGRDASAANMEAKKHLEEITLKWDGDANNPQVVRDVLEKLQPHASIKHLNIEGYCGTVFPDWVGNPSDALSHLESLSLLSCENCLSLPPLGQLKFLQSLEIVGMRSILALTEDFYGDRSGTKPFTSLKKLRIEKLPEWERWHIPECEVFNSLEELRMVDCPNLVGELPKQLSSLQRLEISGCNRLVRPNGRLSIFNGEIDHQQFSSLCKLEVSGLNDLKELPLPHNQLSRLEKLKLDDCGSLLRFHVSRLPPSLKEVKCYKHCNLELQSEGAKDGGTLEDLSFVNRDSLKVMWLDSFTMLRGLTIKDCKGIEKLSITNQTSTTAGGVMLSLEYLNIQNCDELTSFPEGGLAAPKLTWMRLKNCKKLKSQAKRMESLLPSLQYLGLVECPEMECFPEGGLPSSLQTLRIENCAKLISRQREWGLEKLPSLRALRIGGIANGVKPLLEEDWLLPSTLQYLKLICFSNLKELNRSGLQQLTSLQNLYIGDCKHLRSLPEEGLPASLTTLIIDRCPLLKARLEWERGKDWTKVAHIPRIIVDDQLVP